MYNIIGAGLAGSILAKFMRMADIPFRLFDAGYPNSASAVAENLVSEKWENGLEGLRQLERIVPIRDIGKMKHVYREDVLETNYMKAEVVRHVNGCFKPHTNTLYTGKNIYCTGVWTKFLVPTMVVVPILGHGLSLGGQTKDEFIEPYKPFRDLKYINDTRNTRWFSNSLAIKPENYNEFHKNELLRLYKAAKQSEGFYEGYTLESFVKTGLRPKLLPGKSHHYEPVITGGYKTGLIQYAIRANQIVELIKNKKL